MTNDKTPFWRKVELIPFSDCWYWSGALTKGYGQSTYNKKHDYAHRISWKMHYGEIPEGMCVCHKCDNPLCVRPDHLFLGTQAENIKDKLSKGRGRTGKSIGSNNPQSKLNEEKVGAAIAMRKAGQKIREIAKSLGVSKTAVGNIFTKTTWRHVNGI